MRLAEGVGVRATVITNVKKARAKYGPQSAQKIGELECKLFSKVSFCRKINSDEENELAAVG